ncbi:AAA family ATPase (plasmid) [Mycolicibacterium aubagnense]|jgi:superfamily I DNA/RNA helicase|uniref:AAA family ATPase n=1 Tax=Mycolicibacterium aubagnense TaxID=319707 RepID=UPI0019815FF1|nr:AAA family ATPase [Mycolicibacterium aubagnense]WGI36118.1 AAA family ATPase [Mycolicibacterium aubagnense]
MLKPTEEQAAIIDAARAQKHLVIQAGAGTGKTSTLKMVAHALGGRTGIYTAYNRDAAREASRAFPAHVDCRTAHSLAMAAVGYKYRHRLDAPRDLPARRAEVLGTSWLELSKTRSISPVQMARIAVDTVQRFCYSADDELDVFHVPKQNGVMGTEHDALAKIVVPYAQRAWEDVCSYDGALKFQHDHYLKMWALTKPQLSVDVIMLDEGQDSNPVVAQLVQNQRDAQQIAVGDSCQSLYQWRGAIDALDSWPADERLFLSRSWRFGPVIATQANQWLQQIGTPMRLTGNPDLASELADLHAPKAILCRTNAEAMKQVMALLADGQRVALAGGGGGIRALAKAAQDLKNGRRTSHPELFLFATWAALVEYVEDDQAGRDLKPLVDLVEEYGAEAIIEAVDALVDERRATTVVSTAHKAKGREWDTVRIAGDFTEPSSGEIAKVDAMLGYVAVTRARHQLDRRGLAWIDRFTARPKPVGQPTQLRAG